MIRTCRNDEIRVIFDIINDAAEAYRGVIPQDRWHCPYMSMEELSKEVESGVRFWGYEDQGALAGVMGVQEAKDVTLIRHAYVRTSRRRSGIGSEILSFLLKRIDQPVLIGTWEAAVWARKFYEKHGFRQVSRETKEKLLRCYWRIPERQTETSVVLADEKWIRLHPQEVLS